MVRRRTAAKPEYYRRPYKEIGRTRSTCLNHYDCWPPVQWPVYWTTVQRQDGV